MEVMKHTQRDEGEVDSNLESKSPRNHLLASRVLVHVHAHVQSLEKLSRKKSFRSHVDNELEENMRRTALTILGGNQARSLL